MFRIDLSVPFADKNAARMLGARWDSLRRVWFVPSDRDATPFARWLPASSAVNVRASSYFVATSALACHRCGGMSKVHGFALPPGHETSAVDEETGEVLWETSDEPTFVCYLEYVNLPAIEGMRQRTGNYRLTPRRRTRSYYWANFCEHCGSKFGDYDVFCEPGQGFMPLTGEDAARIGLARFEASFTAAAGGWSLGVELFEYMTEAR